MKFNFDKKKSSAFRFNMVVFKMGFDQKFCICLEGGQIELFRIGESNEKESRCIFCLENREIRASFST